MKIAIMQPYLFPYIGYFQLMNAVDEFVVYDNIQYTKKGWINRNRILVDGKDAYITVPLKNDSDYLDIVQRSLAENWPDHRIKILNRLAASYKKAACFEQVYPVIENALLRGDRNLFSFIYNSLVLIKDFLDIKTQLVVSSTIPVDHTLKSDSRVIEICKARKADSYLNPAGGIQLYSKEKFKSEGIDLSFIKTNEFEYAQYNNEFVPYLSIIDVMMFNSKDVIREYLVKHCTLL